MMTSLVTALIAAALAPAPADAACTFNGTAVVCSDLDADGVVVGNNFAVTIQPDAFVQSIYDGEIPSSCSEFVAAVRAGDGARVANRGLVLGRGNCGLGIDAGNALSLTNDGTISTDQDVGYAVVAGNGATIQNNGQINTVGNEATVLIIGNDSRLTNSASGRIGTTGPFTTTLFTGNNVTVANDGRMGAAGIGGTAVDLGARSSMTNGGTITANGAGATGVRLRGDGATLINRGSILAVPATAGPNPTSVGVLAEGQDVTITNESGTITGASAGVVVTGSATINNRATIRGSATSGIRAESGGRFTLINTGRVEGDLIVPAGSRAMGTGTIAGNVQNSGVVAPGLSIGTMTVTGSFVQNGNGRLEIEINGDGTSDRLVVGGPVLSLGGTVAVAFTGAPARNGQSFTFLASSGGILATTRILPAITDNSPIFLNAQVSFGVNQINIIVNRTPYASIASTHSQDSIAQALDVAVRSATTATAPLFLLLDLATADEARAAFDQLAPEALGSLTVPALSSFQALAQTSVAAMSAASRGAGQWRAWGGASHRGSSRTKGVKDRYAASINTVAAGADYAVSDGAALGVMVARTSSNTRRGRAAAVGRQDDDGYALGLTAAGAVGPFEVVGAVGVGDGEVAIARSHGIGSTPVFVASETDTSATFGFIQTEHSYQLGSATVTPSLGVDYARARVKSLTEDGPFGLSIDPHAHRSTRSIARIAIDTALGQIRPRASIGWLHQFADLKADATARIPSAGVGPFTLTGLAAKRDVIEAEAEVILDVAPNAAISFGFGGGLNDRLHGQAVRAGFSFGW